MRLHPTNKLLDALRERGVQWPEVEADLSDPEFMTPIRGFDTRQRVSGEDWQGYVEPDRSGEPNSWVVIGVRPREHPEGPSEHPVVGVEQPLSLPRSRGGVGRRWPTTWGELVERVGKQGYLVEKTQTHIAVFCPGGTRMATLPATASDWRSLLNACQHLRQVGIDVSR